MKPANENPKRRSRLYRSPGTQMLRNLWPVFSILLVLALAMSFASQYGFSQRGVFVTKIGGIKPGTERGQFFYPNNLTVDGQGNVLVADTGNHRVVKLDSEGRWIITFGSAGRGDGQLNLPTDVAVDRQGDFYVADTGNDRIVKFSSAGKFVKAIAGLATPFGVTVDSNGNIYVADTSQHRVAVFSSEGALIKSWGQFGTEQPGDFRFLHDIELDSKGNVYVSDFVNHRIQKFTNDGKFLAMWGSLGRGRGQLNHPWALAFDRDDNLWVADFLNSRMQKFTSEGKNVGGFGTYAFLTPRIRDGQFDHPKGIAIDKERNIAWVAHSGAHRIEKYRLSR